MEIEKFSLFARLIIIKDNIKFIIIQQKKLIILLVVISKKKIFTSFQLVLYYNIKVLLVFVL